MKFTRRHFVGGGVAMGSALFTPQILAAPNRQDVLGTTIPQVMPAAPRPGGIIGEALAALERHGSQIVHRDRLGIADYTVHSREYRFHIVDVGGGRITHSLLVSHGRGSDANNSGFAQRFSNVPGSNASSKGSFVTGEEYVGKHGRSLRLHGLEQQNDRAFARAIVIHGADYVDRDMAANQGRVGRSLGCFAFEQSEIAAVLETLGQGRLLYAAGGTA